MNGGMAVRTLNEYRKRTAESRRDSRIDFDTVPEDPMSEYGVI
ncbi:hypothetical protein [Paenibacillus puldeungensis]